MFRRWALGGVGGGGGGLKFFMLAQVAMKQGVCALQAGGAGQVDIN